MSPVTVDFGQEIGPFAHFWQSTGFTPAGHIFHADMRQNVIYIGSVPHGGITHNRIHFLLDLVTAAGLGTAEPQYDWSRLDAALDLLLTNHQKPFFELMGNPSGYFSDFTDAAQLSAWRRLVRDLARHCIERHGAAEVRSWYFETWNEPDNGYGKMPWTGESFAGYYDACSEGLKDADPELRFGGPGVYADQEAGAERHNPAVSAG